MSTNYLIQNGEVFDGSGSASAKLDVRVSGSTIAQMNRALKATTETVIDASGLLVVPGLIDLHVHAFTGFGQFGLAPEEIGLRSGVTTMLDAGTTGALTYPALKQLIIDKAREDIFAVLNISVIGCMQGHPKIPPFMGELSDIRYANVPAAVKCIQKHGPPLIGMKARLTKGLANNSLKNEKAGLYGALDAAKQTGTFLMVHHVNSAIPVEEFLGAMRRGDIVTHLYHPHNNSPFDKKTRKPVRAALRARDRGVIMDVGHGVGSFGWEVAEPACQEHGFWPDTISTDIHQFNLYGPVYDMPTTMSKFLHLGMPLSQIIRASTHAPARAMGLGGRFGLLKKGRQADITLLRVEKGSFELEDILGKKRTARQRLVPVAVFKKGEYFPCQHATANERVHAPKPDAKPVRP